MTLIPVNISASLDPVKITKDEIGMNLMDLRILQGVVQKMLPPEQGQIVGKILENIAASMQTLAALASVTQAGMNEAILQRDAAVNELNRLTQAMQQIDQEDPNIATLVRTVWDAAQADAYQRIDAERGA
jgi:hypothetical protein